MKKGLKWIAAAFLSVVILIALLPWFMGILVEHQYHRLAAVWSGSQLGIQVMDYHRGWIHSQATVKITITHPTVVKASQWLNANSDPNQVSIVLQQDIEHGPVLRIRQPSGGKNWVLGYAVVYTQNLSGAGTVNAATLMNFLGEIISIAQIPDLHYFNGTAQVTLQITGATVLLTVSRHPERLWGQIYLPQLALRTPAFRQTLLQFTQAFNLEKSDSGLFLGDRITKIGAISWQTPDNQNRVDFTGFDLRTHSAQHHQQLSYDLQGRLRNINYDSSSYGPQKIAFSIDGMNVWALLAIHDALTHPFDHANLSSKGTQGMTTSQLWLNLFSKGLNFKLNTLSLITPWGEAQAQGAAVVPSAPLAGMQDLLGRVQVEIDAKAPAQLLSWVLTYAYEFLGAASQSKALAQRQMDQWMQENTLIHLGDRMYQLRFSIRPDTQR